MSGTLEVGGDNARIVTVKIDSLVGAFGWIKWINVAILSEAVYVAIEALGALLRSLVTGHIDSSVYGFVGFGALLAFPGWMAWKNIDVVSSVTRKYTIRSLIFVAAIGVLLALLVFPAANQAFNGGPEDIPAGVTLIESLAAALVAGLAAAATWRLRRRSVDGLNIKLVKLIEDLSSQGTLRAESNVRPQHALLGWSLIGIAVVMMIGIDYVPLDVYQIAGQLAQASFLLILVARAAFQPSAQAVLASDKRKPILLLRSFVDDELVYFRSSENSFVDSSVESRLASHFAGYGPFIAVGSPKEKLAVIGAARALLPETEWQAQVLRWIDDSSAIVLFAGLTHWVDWELQKVLEHGASDRLIICFPPLGSRNPWRKASRKKFRADMQSRLLKLKHAFIGTRWSETLANLGDPASLRAIVLKQDGQITVVRTRSRSRNAYHLAVLVAHWINLNGGRSLTPASCAVASPGLAHSTATHPTVEI